MGVGLAGRRRRPGASRSANSRLRLRRSRAFPRATRPVGSGSHPGAVGPPRAGRSRRLCGHAAWTWSGGRGLVRRQADAGLPANVCGQRRDCRCALCRWAGVRGRGRTWQMTSTERADCYAEFCRALLPVAEYAGERGVAIGVEALNRYEHSLINTVEQTLHPGRGVNRYGRVPPPDPAAIHEPACLAMSRFRFRRWRVHRRARQRHRADQAQPGWLWCSSAAAISVPGVRCADHRSSPGRRSRHGAGPHRRRGDRRCR